MSKSKYSLSNCSEKCMDLLSSIYLSKKYTHEEYLMCNKKCTKDDLNDSKKDLNDSKKHKKFKFS